MSADDSDLPPGLRLWGLDGVGEVSAGDDLADLLLTALKESGLEPVDGDVLAVTSKVVSKAEGATSVGDRSAAVVDDTAAVVARRGPTTIVRTRHGLVLAAAGIDVSNVAPGTLVHLPPDPDGSARRLRAALRERTGLRLGVIVTDTAGRPWRVGQTDMAIGVAGIRVLDDHEGRDDTHGNRLTVTAPAVADEIAGAAELATQKTSGRPFCLVRGLGAHVTDEDGPGAVALVRPTHLDMFALGTREAVVAACSPRPPDAFGAPVDDIELVHRLADLVEPVGVGCELSLLSDQLEVATEATLEPGCLVAQGELVADVVRVAIAHGWRLADRRENTDTRRSCHEVALRLEPRTP